MFHRTTTAIVCVLATAGLAWAQKEGRPVPGNGTIDMPGSYVLQQDRFAGSDRPAILITASNVSLDLNGMMLSGPGGKLGVGVEIRNASGVRVSGGFMIGGGIWLALTRAK